MAEEKAPKAGWKGEAYMESAVAWERFNKRTRELRALDRIITECDYEMTPTREATGGSMQGPIEIFVHDLNTVLVGTLMTIEFVTSDTGSDQEIFIDEETNYEAQKYLENEDEFWSSPGMEDLKSSSRTPVFTSVGQGNQSGTSVSKPGCLWTLERLMSRNNHYNVYSSRLIPLYFPQRPVVSDDDPIFSIWKMRVYSFHGLPDQLAKYRRRNMKRLSVPHEIFIDQPELFAPISQGGNIYVPYIDEESPRMCWRLQKDLLDLNLIKHGYAAYIRYFYGFSWFLPPQQRLERADYHKARIEISRATTQEAEPRKEKARVKQRDRRRRHRESKRDDHAQDDTRNVHIDKPAAVDGNL